MSEVTEKTRRVSYFEPLTIPRLKSTCDQAKHLGRNLMLTAK